MDGQLIFELVILVISLILLRIFYLVHKITTGNSNHATNKRIKPAKTAIIVGSGGHTTEILNLVNSLDFKKYTKRCYIMAKSDETSYAKICRLEKQKSSSSNDYEVIQIPRSRVVHQSYFTSVFTTLFSILYSIPVLCKVMPDLILCNGPGTCIPVCAVAFLLKAAFISDIRIVFIESFCRTRTFSLSGKILLYFADNILVQWPSLKKRLKRADYIGQLM